jgi:AraC-like DNA-binding protein
MVKLRTFDNAQLLIEHSEKPHYKDDVVCFRSEYKDKIHLENEQYFNKELYMILVLEGYSKIRLNGELITIGANTLLIHGANYLTEHLDSSKNIKFITLFISESMRTDDSYLTQITSILLATMRQNGQYTIELTEEESMTIRRELESLMYLLKSEHHFLFRRIQASCNGLFLDIADFLSRKTIIKKHIGHKDHVLQKFHALVTRHFREEHFINFYADKLAISNQYLSRIVRAGTGKSVNDIISNLLIMEARTLLSSRNLTVNGISARLCFNDTAGFCKFFKRKTKQTPLNYRKGLLMTLD